MSGIFVVFENKDSKRLRFILDFDKEYQLFLFVSRVELPAQCMKICGTPQGCEPAIWLYVSPAQTVSL